MTVWLVYGDDEVLLAGRVNALVNEFVGSADRSLMVDDLDGVDYAIAAIVDAAQTPPFLTDTRVVVARGVERFTTDELPVLAAYLADPLPTTALILATAGGRAPKLLSDAVKRGGGDVVSSDVSSRARDRLTWIDEQLAASGLRVDAAARNVVAETLGEDINRLGAVLETLESTFGAGARLHADDIRPFLGDAGAVPPWELTDAIDRGDTAAALANLSRLVRGGERHPLQILATLHAHYTRMLRLDGAGASDEATAAALLGMKGSTYPARKALDQGRRLGHDGVARAVNLLAAADLDLRGAKEWSGDLVLEVLVARLSKLGPSRGVSRRS
ncbi:MAG: DNA polymerase III subunit delta [Acidimicrobiales bacterium]